MCKPLANPHHLPLKLAFCKSPTADRHRIASCFTFLLPQVHSGSFFAVFRDGHRRCEQFLLRAKWMIRCAGPLQPRDHRRWRARLKHYGMGHGNLRFHSRRTVRVRVKSQNLSQSRQQGQDEGEKKKKNNIRGESRSTSCFYLFNFLAPTFFSWSKLPLNRTVSLQSLFNLNHWSIAAFLFFCIIRKA